MTSTQGKIEEITLYSESLQTTVPIMVYKPANYSPLYKYHVVILQDGKDYFQLGRLPRTADSLLAEGAIENSLFFAVPYPDVTTRENWYHPDSPNQKQYSRFIAHELVPYIDQHFPTFQMGNGRMLMGDSLAATASLLTAITYPNSFGKVAMHSPFVNDTVLRAVTDFSSPELLSIYHVIGDEEDNALLPNGTRKNFLTPNRELHEVMKKRDYTVFYEEFKGSHSWKYWQPDMRRTLQKML